MSYKIGAFDALAWAWHMLRRYRDDPNGVDEGRQVLKETLAKLGAGDEVSFEVDIKATFQEKMEVEV